MSDFDRFCEMYSAPEESLVALDYSRLGMEPDYIEKLGPALSHASDAMDALEKGAIANPDEKRMVGHYWLRALDMIPDATLRDEVKKDLQELRKFVEGVTTERIKAPSGNPFRNILSIGIGGSALGPELVADALGKDKDDKLRPYFMDNTDPEGIARVLGQLEGQLAETVVLVISKSGGTPETRNGMLFADAAYRAAGLNFGKHAVAITGRGSKLDTYAKEHGWLSRLPMYDWVGGRTSIMSAVGLAPAGLQGVDLDAFLSGAAKMDAVTRARDPHKNPALIMAACWHFATNGRGQKDMVVLPYKDRLLLFSRYLQQLVMESLGKEFDLNGNKVEQGISVYGNKGSTDQHAYVQQLRDGVPNFFAVFVEVLEDGGNSCMQVDPGVTAGDYLSGFLQGTRSALAEKKRGSITLVIERVNAETLGAMIALFERAVGFYATLINVNAYHQPGVEAGKKAAEGVLAVQKKLLEAVSMSPGEEMSAEGWATEAGCDAETAFRILQHLSYNNRGIVMKGRVPGAATFTAMQQ
ncbi:glucose-6-phosphate isomerase [soil metagenome]